MKITPVILSGGDGSRLWPLSNNKNPKQFISFNKNESLFRRTIQRCKTELFTSPLIVTSTRYKSIALSQAKEENCLNSEIIVEPTSKNTAPAIFLAAMKLAQLNPEGLLLVLPSDHLIPDPANFSKIIEKGIKPAQDGFVVTLGIKPDYPETDFGYIETEFSEKPWYSVKSFHEKPPLHLAEKFQSNNRYFWNAGIFLCRADTVIKLIKTFIPEVNEQVTKALDHANEALPFIYVNPEDWLNCPSESFDIAVMEKAENIVCIPFTGKWFDLGSLQSFCANLTLDKDDNFLNGPAVSLENRNTVIWSEDGSRPLMTAGLTDMVVISTHEAVLVTSNKHLLETKEVIQKLENTGQQYKNIGTTTLKPWGYYEVLNEGNNFKVKSLHVYPGGELSLQSHKHRSEHWTVVKGNAIIQIGDEIIQAFTEQSVEIGTGVKHRVSNKTSRELIIIEVQTGPIIDEDDIIRYEDIYNR